MVSIVVRTSVIPEAETSQKKREEAVSIRTDVGVPVKVVSV